MQRIYPSSARPAAIEQEMKKLSSLDRKVICGDINAHHPAWDSYIPKDARGEMIEKWTEDAGLVILNDGAATRYARHNSGGGRSAPDLTLMSPQDALTAEWRTHDELGSDHLPIIIKWRKEVRTENSKRKAVPNFKKGRLGYVSARSNSEPATDGLRWRL